MGSAALAVLAAAFAVGVVSALLPVVTAELYLAAVVAVSSGAVGLLAAVALGAGQTVGKVVLFTAARRGRRWAAGHAGRPRSRSRAALRRRTAGWAASPLGRRSGAVRARLRAWGERGIGLLDRPWPAAGVLLTSASVGVPPLAATSVAAGLRTTGPWLFAACTLAGRVVRFGLLAWGGGAAVA